MTEQLVDQIFQQLEPLSQLYHRLLLLVALAGRGKTVTLQAVASRLDLAVINLNLELSRGLLELPAQERTLKLPKILQRIVDASPQDVILLDNTEILFGVALQHDPLRLLQQLSRNKSVVATWNGVIQNGCLTYAAPGHPEYRKYQVKEFVAIETDH